MSNQSLQLNNPDNAYIYKKTERLVSALYLLTSFISDKESVKWQIRETGLKLLPQVLLLSDKPLQGTSLITLILSFLEVAYLGGIISEMNHNILKFEFENLIKVVENMEKEKVRGAVLSEQFFIPKGQDNMSDRFANKIGDMSFKNIELKQKDKSNRPPSAEVSSGRQGVIISLLKNGNNLGIKDFTAVIKDCSEKTIQRELATLVSKGQIKKEGEKRWSRYSLK